MGNFKIGITSDKDFLNKLTQESNSGVEMQTAKHHLALHPIHLNNLNESVKDLLNEKIAKYNQNLNGIMLGYGKIKLLSNMGVINNDSPYIHYDLLVDFYVFKPQIGKEMEGTVNRKSKDHVGILVYNTFNVSIPKPENEVNWLGDSVSMGYEVLFRITFIDLSSYLPYIKGDLISVSSGVSNETSNNTKKALKKKKIVFDSDEDNNEPVSKRRKLDDDTEDNVKQKKSKKKKKEKYSNSNSLEEINTVDLLQDSIKSDENKSNKKSKKKKKDKT